MKGINTSPVVGMVAPWEGASNTAVRTSRLLGCPYLHTKILLPEQEATEEV